MVKLADTQDLESCGAIRIGSNPFDGIRHTPPIRGRGFVYPHFPVRLPSLVNPLHSKIPFAGLHFPRSHQNCLKENADNTLPLPSSYIFPPETACETGFRSKTFPIVRLDYTDDAAFILSDFSAPVVQFYNNPFPISHEFFSASGK